MIRRQLQLLLLAGAVLPLMVGIPISVTRTTSWSSGQQAEVVLYQEDFEDGHAQGWNLPAGWRVSQDVDGNRVLRGAGHQSAAYTRDAWADHALALRVRILRGRIHLNFRASGCLRYFIGVQEDRVDLNKTQPCGTHRELCARDRYFSANRWYGIKIVGKGNKIEVFVEGWSVITFADSSPLLLGGIALETLSDSEFLVDDIRVTGSPPSSYTGPLIDAHSHLPVPPGSPLARSIADTMVTHMDRAGVQAAFIYGLHALPNDQEDRTVLEQATRHPGRLLPFLRGFRLTDPEAASRYVLPQLATGRWSGLGELYVRHCEAGQVHSADHPALMRVLEAAGTFGVPVAIHFEPFCQVDRRIGEAELERALAANPRTTFILCHGGMGFVTAERVATYRNFYVVCEVLPGVTDFVAMVYNLWVMAPTRVLVGTDVIPEIWKWGWRDYGHMLEGLRAALGKLPSDAAADVAYRNAARLLGLEIPVP